MVNNKEAIKFFRVQLSRCKINLKGASDRKDERALINIQRKIEIYRHTIDKLSLLEEMQNDSSKL